MVPTLSRVCTYGAYPFPGLGFRPKTTLPLPSLLLSRSAEASPGVYVLQGLPQQDGVMEYRSGRPIARLPGNSLRKSACCLSVRKRSAPAGRSQCKPL